MSNKNNPYLGSYTGYIIGFIVCLIISILIFIIVGQKLITSTHALIVTIVVFAIAQLLVQLKCFLHLGFKSDNVWNLTVLVFTGIILFILVAGSLWIMFSLSQMMMVH